MWRPQKCGRYEIRAEALILGAEETSSTVFVIVKSSDQLMLVYISILVILTVALVITVLIFRKRVENGNVKHLHIRVHMERLADDFSILKVLCACGSWAYIKMEKETVLSCSTRSKKGGYLDVYYEKFLAAAARSLRSIFPSRFKSHPTL
jgi:hypothetical protein